MKEFFFTFRSILPAQQARNKLQSNGIACRLTRTPMKLQDNGCGYSVRVDSKDYARARRLLSGYGRIYLHSVQGSYEVQEE